MMAQTLRGLAVAVLLAVAPPASAAETPPQDATCPEPPSTGELGFLPKGPSAKRCAGVRRVTPYVATDIAGKDIGRFLVNHIGLDGEQPSFVAILAIAVISDARDAAFVSLRRNKGWRDYRSRRLLDPKGLEFNEPRSPETFLRYHHDGDQAGLDRFLGKRLHGIPDGSDRNSWETRDGWVQDLTAMTDCAGGRCSVTLRLLRFVPAPSDTSAKPVDFTLNTAGFRKLHIWTFSPHYDEFRKRYEINLID